MAKILHHLGYELSYKEQQTCCGQPAFNAGYRDEARHVAANFIELFKESEVIVGPSGSCTAMVKNYYPVLFKKHELEEEAKELGNKIFEFSQFLEREHCIDKINGSYTGSIGFHNSCHSYRELRIEDQPIKILNRISSILVFSVFPGLWGFLGLRGLSQKGDQPS